MGKYTNVGTEGHIDHGKQVPQLLIVGEVSKNFEGAYKVLLEMEKREEVEIIYRNSLEYGDTFEGCRNTQPVCLTGDEEFNYPKPVYKDNKHKHPHWHKGRW